MVQLGFIPEARLVIGPMNRLAGRFG